jgi:hypothetical protein
MAEALGNAARVKRIDLILLQMEMQMQMSMGIYLGYSYKMYKEYKL